MNEILTVRKEYDKGDYALIQELNSEKHGWWISFNADNSKKWERFYLFGKQNGPEREWSKYGVLMHERSFKEDLLDGPWKIFYENGQLKNDTWFTNGNQDLFSRWYDKEGQLITELTIVGGQKHGTEIAQVIIDESTYQTTQAIVTFDNGKFKGFEPFTLT